MGEADTSIMTSIITGVLGLVSGTVGYYLVHHYLERKREFLATKRQQLQYVFAPLEILLKMNKREFDRYFRDDTTLDDRIFIEKNIWYQNNTEIKKILMEKSHLLNEIPEVFLKLLTHINVWLTEYELVYEKNEKGPPVFAGPKGYSFPVEVDEYVHSRAKELRETLNV